MVNSLKFNGNFNLSNIKVADYQIVNNPTWQEFIFNGSLAQPEGYDGGSVDITPDGNTIIFGSPTDTVVGQGEAYIFSWNGSNWIEEIKLPDAALMTNMFEIGDKVAINDDASRAFVSYNRFDGLSNFIRRVEVYNKVSGIWTNAQTISIPENGDDLVISGDGNRLFSSQIDYNNPSRGSNAGIVQVFDWNGSTWDNSSLSGSVVSAKHYFGKSLSCTTDGNTLVVGAPVDTTAVPSKKGDVYVFDWDGLIWNETTILQPSDGVNDDTFGSFVQISPDGNYIAVAAYNHDNSPLTNTGAVYIYEKVGLSWVEQQKIVLDISSTTDTIFGFSFDFNQDGSRLVIGASFNDTQHYTGNDRIYIYERSGGIWNLTNELITSTPDSDYRLGFAISLNSDGSRIAVGAPNRIPDDGGPTNKPGRVHVFHEN